MKNFGAVALLALTILGSSQTVRADETPGEKVHAVVNSAARGVKKGANRVTEAACMKGDLKCAGDKAKNRAVETKDAVVDKVEETANKVD